MIDITYDKLYTSTFIQEEVSARNPESSRLRSQRTDDMSSDMRLGRASTEPRVIDNSQILRPVFHGAFHLGQRSMSLMVTPY
jgi:hypothetical protein